MTNFEEFIPIKIIILNNSRHDCQLKIRLWREKSHPRHLGLNDEHCHIDPERLMTFLITLPINEAIHHFFQSSQFFSFLVIYCLLSFPYLRRNILCSTVIITLTRKRKQGIGWDQYLKYLNFYLRLKYQTFS